MASDNYTIEIGFRVLNILQVGAKYMVVTYQLSVAGEALWTETLVLSADPGDGEPVLLAA